MNESLQQAIDLLHVTREQLPFCCVYLSSLKMKDEKVDYDVWVSREFNEHWYKIENVISVYSETSLKHLVRTLKAIMGTFPQQIESSEEDETPLDWQPRNEHTFYF